MGRCRRRDQGEDGNGTIVEGNLNVASKHSV